MQAFKTYNPFMPPPLLLKGSKPEPHAFLIEYQYLLTI